MNPRTQTLSLDEKAMWRQHEEDILSVLRDTPISNVGEVLEIALGRDEARSLTERIKAHSEELWHLLLEAYEGNAHTALGYKSWGSYFEEEFGGERSRAYRLLDAGRVVREIESQSPIGDSPKPNEAQRSPGP
jgi:hypothetical protein